MSRVLQYPGSKTKMSPLIISLFPPHRCYVEVFGGSASVLLQKPPSDVEVYNDINDDIVTLFRIMREDISREQLQTVLSLTPYSRTELLLAQSVGLPKHKYASDLEHARLTFLLYNQSVSGLAYHSNSWSFGKTESQAEDFRTRVEAMTAIGKRLANVQIECAHFSEVIPRFDTPDTLFYLDPPYDPETVNDKLYKHEMYIHEHKQLVEMLLRLKGKAVLSGYDTPLYAPLEKAGYEKILVEVTTTLDARSSRKATEVLWVSPQELIVEEPTDKNVKTAAPQMSMMFGDE